MQGERQSRRVSTPGASRYMTKSFTYDNDLICAELLGASGQAWFIEPTRRTDSVSRFGGALVRRVDVREAIFELAVDCGHLARFGGDASDDQQ